MATGLWGKPRSPPHAQGIPSPRFRYGDVPLRAGLRHVERSVSYSRPIDQVVQAEQHPKLSEKRHLRKNTKSPALEFDFQLRAPPNQPAQEASTPFGENEAMIGIAIGSPRFLESHNIASQTQRNRPPTPPPKDSGRSSGMQHKLSKWRKIGHLFKAKNAISSNANKPFYRVRTTNEEPPPQGSSHSIEYQPRPTPETNTESIQNTNVWPCLVSENESHQQAKPKEPGSLLQVEIPQVQMERYSVMFDGLVNSSNNSRPSLLDRRSKTLDNVTIPCKEAPQSPPLLEPPRRPESSPAHSRAPSFTLFPTMPPNKASNVLGAQNFPRPPKPLQIQNPPQKRIPAKKAQKTVSPDTDSKGDASHRPQSPVTSFLSLTSIGSDDEPFLITNVEPARTSDSMKQPNRETHNRKPQSSKNLTVNTHRPKSHSDSSIRSTASASASASASTTSSPLLAPLALPPKSSARLSPSPQSGNQAITFPPPRTTSRQNGGQPTAIKVSVARSISMAKGQQQVLVPIRTAASQFHPGRERLVNVVRQAKMPKVTTPQFGHRPGLSQDVLVEMA